ncbi:MAG: ChrR family anti-sigma-E factor [Pseudomonadota bacterium]
MRNENFSSMDSLLSGYVAGTLPVPVQVLMESHLELSKDNHGFVAGLEAAAGEQLSDLAPTALRDRDSALEAIFAAEPMTHSVQHKSRCDVMPSAMYDFIGFNVDTIPWKTKMPGFREYDLPDVDGCHVSMFWIKPGRTVPAHTHEGVELSLIIDGAFHDTRGRFGRGDISIADDSVDHRPTAEADRPCIGFAVCDGALRLTGPLHQRLGDIISG